MAKKKQEYKFWRFVKDIDLFGYPVQLNFDEKGPTHQTCCGGLATFAFLILVIIAVLGQMIAMSSKSQTMFFSHEYAYNPIDTTAEDMVDASLGLSTFVYLVDTSTDNLAPVSTSWAEYYLNIVYVGKGGDAVQAVQCTNEHFSDTRSANDDSEEVLKQMDAVSGAMFCPANTLTNPLNLTLQISCVGTCDEAVSGYTAVTMMVASKPNMANQANYPLFSYIFETGSFALNTRRKYWHTVPLRFNQMILHTKGLGLGGNGGATTLSFIDNQYANTGAIIEGTSSSYNRLSSTSLNSYDQLLSQSFELSSLAMRHHMRVYTLWVWLAVIGGIIQSLILLFKWGVRPFAKHGFILRALKRLYFVRTKDESLFKVRSNDSIRYKRDFPEIHDDVKDWPVLTDPCESAEELCDSVIGDNFVMQGQSQSGRNSARYSQEYEGGNNTRQSPRFVDNGSSRNSRGNSKGRNPRSKKTYMEDTPMGNDATYSKTGSKAGSKQPLNKNKKQAATKKVVKKQTGRKIQQMNNPVLEVCSQQVQEEISTHRTIRIYNTKWFGMFLCNAIRFFFCDCCCNRKACDCCCDGCFSNMKHFEVYDEGKRRLDEEMDVIKIMKKMRHMYTMMNSTHVHSEKRRLKLAHTFNNVIDIVESDDECCTYQQQDRKMKIAALDGEELPEDVNQQQKGQVKNNQKYAKGQPFTPTMGGDQQDCESQEGGEPIPAFENEVDKNIDHQVVHHGYPVGVPCCQPLPPPPVVVQQPQQPPPVYYEPMPQEVMQHKPKQSRQKLVDNSFQPPEQHRNDQQERFVKKQQQSHSAPRNYKPREPRGSAGEQSYGSEGSYDSQYSSEKQKYYNDRNGSQVRSASHEPYESQSASKVEKDHAPIHDFRQEKPKHKKPDPQSDLYTEQRKMTLPRYKQGKKFDQSQKNPNAVLNKYNRFEVEER